MSISIMLALVINCKIYQGLPFELPVFSLTSLIYNAPRWIYLKSKDIDAITFTYILECPFVPFKINANTVSPLSYP